MGHIIPKQSMMLQVTICKSIQNTIQCVLKNSSKEKTRNTAVWAEMRNTFVLLLGNLPKDQELEKVIWPNIALSMRTGPHTLYNVGAIFQKSF